MLVYGGLLAIVVLALLGIALTLRGAKQPAQKVKVQERKQDTPAPATSAQPTSQTAQVAQPQLTPPVQATGELKRINASNDPINPITPLPGVTDIQPLPRNDAISLVTNATDSVSQGKHRPHSTRLVAIDEDRIVLTRGQFGALLSELRALRQHSEELAERLEIVSETLGELTPTQIEFSAVSFKTMPETNGSSSVQRAEQYLQ